MEIEQSNAHSANNNEAPIPQYYSQRAIWGFILVYTPLAGSILLMWNILRTKNKIGAIYSLIFGIIYTPLIYFITALVAETELVYLLMIAAFYVLAAIILNHVFWNKYIGKETDYKRKSIIYPSIIWILVILLIYALNNS